jgi:amino acid transporter
VSSIESGAGEKTGAAPAAAATTEHHHLSRSLGFIHNQSLVLAAAAPAVTVFIYVPVLFFVVGSFSFVATLIGTVIAFGVALCYAEVTTAYPFSGAEYAVVGRAVNKGLGFVLFAVMMVFYVLLTATYCYGFGLEVQTIWTSAPVRIMGLAVLAVATFISFFRVRMGSYVTMALVALELVTVSIVTVLGLAHAHAPADRLIHITAFGTSGPIGAITWSFILLGLTLAFFNMTGFNCAAMLAEETMDVRRDLPRAYLIAVVWLFVFVAIPTGALLLGAPSLKGLFTNVAPMNYLMQSLGFSRLATFVNLAVCFAIFNSLIALMIMYGRVLWSAARDGAFPSGADKVISHLSPRGRVPWVASLIMAVASGAAMFSSKIIGLVTLSGFITIIYMGLVAFVAVWLHYKKDAPQDRFHIPGGIIIPVAVIVSFIVFATGQTRHDLYIVLGTIAVALVYYFAYLWPRRERLWQMPDDVGTD